MRNTRLNQLNVFEFSGCSTDWVLPPNTIRLISTLLTWFSYHAVVWLKRQTSNRDSLRICPVRRRQASQTSRCRSSLLYTKIRKRRVRWNWPNDKIYLLQPTLLCRNQVLIRGNLMMQKHLTLRRFKTHRTVVQMTGRKLQLACIFAWKHIIHKFAARQLIA